MNLWKHLELQNLKRLGSLKILNFKYHLRMKPDKTKQISNSIFFFSQMHR
jgi:hypothetical protein